MTITAVIWDFDGTILDTEWPAYVAAQREFERLGVELPFEDWQDTIGTADHEPWWEVLRRRVGGFDEDDATLLGRYRALKNEMTDAADLMPGVRPLFERLADDGLPCGVASSSSVEWVERHCRRHGIWERFSSVATRTDVGVERTKPEPDLFTLAAERGQWSPADCLVIEDSKHGVEAARRAGMWVVAVPNRITAGQDFSAAHVVVESLVELDLDAALGW